MAKNVNNAGVGAVPMYAKIVKQQRERIAELEAAICSHGCGYSGGWCMFEYPWVCDKCPITTAKAKEAG